MRSRLRAPLSSAGTIEPLAATPSWSFGLAAAAPCRNWPSSWLRRQAGLPTAS